MIIYKVFYPPPPDLVYFDDMHNSALCLDSCQCRIDRNTTVHNSHKVKHLNLTCQLIKFYLCHSNHIRRR